MTQDYDKSAVEYFSKQQDFDKPSPKFFRKQGSEWTPVSSPAPTSHPIAPPPELVQQWARAQALGTVPVHSLLDFAEKVAQWGADQELEACCEWLKSEGHEYEHEVLRTARRPKPPSLKEQALEELSVVQIHLNKFGIGMCTETIRRALKSIND